MKKLAILICLSLALTSCKKDKDLEVETIAVETEEKVSEEFGFNLDDYVVKKDTIRKGDSFGEILERNKVGYPQIFQIAEKAKDTFDIRRLQIGKPYTLLCSKDSLEQAKCFIYQPNLEEYVVIQLQDSVHAYTSRKPIKYVEKGCYRRNKKG